MIKSLHSLPPLSPRYLGAASHLQLQYILFIKFLNKQFPNVNKKRVSLGYHRSRSSVPPWLITRLPFFAPLRTPAKKQKKSNGQAKKKGKESNLCVVCCVVVVSILAETQIKMQI